MFYKRRPVLGKRLQIWKMSSSPTTMEPGGLSVPMGLSPPPSTPSLIGAKLFEKDDLLACAQF